MLVVNVANVASKCSRIQVRLYSMASKFLVENGNYEFLKELGLKKVNPGVYDGQWNANGEVRGF